MVLAVLGPLCSEPYRARLSASEYEEVLRDRLTTVRPSFWATLHRTSVLRADEIIRPPHNLMLAPGRQIEPDSAKSLKANTIYNRSKLWGSRDRLLV
jgi:hypothetical protein